MINHQTSNVKSSATDTRQRIIMAASKLFFKQGYARTTTREIASEAEITEVTLFRHFETKKNLFTVAAEQYGDISGLVKDLESNLTGDYQEDMLAIGQIYMMVVKERKDVIKLMLAEAHFFPEVRESVAKAPRELRKMLAGYLQKQIDKGVLRDINPNLAANAFWGLFLSHHLSKVILNEPAVPNLSDDEVVTQFVGLIVEGSINK
jgi:AcrR family transcriptional regulator